MHYRKDIKTTTIEETKLSLVDMTTEEAQIILDAVSETMRRTKSSIASACAHPSPYHGQVQEYLVKQVRRHRNLAKIYGGIKGLIAA